MHIFQPKHIKLKKDEIDELLKKYNISLTQLPRIKIIDQALPADVKKCDVIRIERKSESGKTFYYRVVEE